MGRAKGANHPVYAPPRGQKSFAAGGQRNPSARHKATQPGRVNPGEPNRFHREDMQHFPQVLTVAGKLRDRALARSRPQMTGHAVEAAMNDHLRPLTRDEVFSALRSGDIIELNDGPDNTDCRMLVRDEHGTCVVYSVGSHRVVTCWWNDPSDSHSTLDLDKYRRLRAGEGDRVSEAALKNAQKRLVSIVNRGVGMVAR